MAPVYRVGLLNGLTGFDGLAKGVFWGRYLSVSSSALSAEAWHSATFHSVATGPILGSLRTQVRW